MLASPSDEFTGGVFQAISDMMLDVLATVARKDYDDRRRRQAQGQTLAKAAGLHKGRHEDTARTNGMAVMLKAGASYTQVRATFGWSPMTIAKIGKCIASAKQAEAGAACCADPHKGKTNLM